FATFAAAFFGLTEARPAARGVLVRLPTVSVCSARRTLFFGPATALATGSVGASSDDPASGLRRLADATPFRGSVSGRLIEMTRASSALLLLLEEVRVRFDEDAMPAIFIEQRRMATFLPRRATSGAHRTGLLWYAGIRRRAR